MLPQYHFLIAALVITPIALLFYPELTLAGVGLWVLYGGFLSAAIDLDIIALVQLRSKEDNRLKPFTKPIEIFRKFSLFMDTLFETGLLRTAMKTHFILGTIFIIGFYLSSNQYFIPVTLGVTSHLVSDTPNIRRVLINSKDFDVE